MPIASRADTSMASSADQSGAQTGALGTSESSASANANALSSTGADAFMGVGRSAYTFDLPTARGRAQPHLGLAYSSEAGTSAVGKGWSLGLPMIERRAPSGPPTFMDPVGDDFYFNAQKLVSICGKTNNPNECIPSERDLPPEFVNSNLWREYRLLSDTSFARFFWSPQRDMWYVVHRDGITYELGGNGATDEVDDAISAAPHGILRWYLSREYDAVRRRNMPLNTIEYGWQKLTSFRGRAYLTDVFYTAPQSQAGMRTFDRTTAAFHVHLGYELPSYLAAPAFQQLRPPSWLEVPTLRLARVDVTSMQHSVTERRSLLRRYYLVYQEYARRSYLHTVTEEGRCPTEQLEGNDLTLPNTSCPRLPATIYDYSFPAVVSLPTTMTGTVDALGGLFDVDSDGIPDFVGLTHNVFLSSSRVWNTIEPSAKLAPSVGGHCTDSYIATKPSGYVADFGALAYVASANDRLELGGAVCYPVKTNDGFQWAESTWQALPLDSHKKKWMSNGYTKPSPCGGGLFGQADATVMNYQNWVGEVPLAIVDVDGDGYPDELTQDIYSTGTLSLFHQVCDDQPNWDGSTPEHIERAYIGARYSRVTQSVLTTGALIPFASRAPNLSPFVAEPGPDGPQPSVLPPANTPFTQQMDARNNTHAKEMFVPPSEGRVFFVDMDADGIVDWVKMMDGLILYWRGQGNGKFGDCGGGDTQCSDDQRETFGQVSMILPRAFHLQTRASPTDLKSVPIAGTDNVYVHDVTGDGLPDLLLLFDKTIELYTNKDGFRFELAATAYANVGDSYAFFGDMNASGVDDLVLVTKAGKAMYIDFLSGTTPGLLLRTQTAGGGSVTLEYKSTPQLAADAALTSGPGAGPWALKSPQVMHVVTKMDTSNGLAGVLGVHKTVQYTYRDPAYDARDRSIRGFRVVTSRNVGDMNDPTTVTRTTFYVGKCEVDAPQSGLCRNDYEQDRPFDILTGLPYLTETFDEMGNYLGASFKSYGVTTEKYPSTPSVRFVYENKTQTYIYDRSIPASSRAPMAGSSVTYIGTNGAQVTQFTTTAQVPSATLAVAHVWTEHEVDLLGNTSRWTDHGNDLASPPDPVINKTYRWTRPDGDPTGTMWRATQLTIDALPQQALGAIAYPDQVHTVTAHYDSAGNLEWARSPLTGTKPLDIRHEDPSKTPNVTPPNVAAEGELVETVHYVRDAFGNPRQVTGPRGARCTITHFDDVYALNADGTQTFTSGAGCSGPALTTSATYDRGLGAPTMTVSPDVATTMVAYDGFGRLKSIAKPDPVTGLAATSPQVVVNYFDFATAPQRIDVSAFDGVGYRKSVRYVDALGATLVALREADKSESDATGWIASGVARRSAKGTRVEAFVPFFWNGTDPTQFPVSAPPTLTSRKTVLDAFGRQTQQSDVDGTMTVWRAYRGLSMSAYDAEGLNPKSKHYGRFVTTLRDGHGRVVQTTRHVVQNGKSDDATDKIVYTASGQPAVLTLSHAGAGDVVTRALAYDSFGRVVQNFEPNTGVNSSRGWRYAYDADGDMVGVTDTRGCGEIAKYDGMGRTLWEDYLPCLNAQRAYTAPRDDGYGTEAFYQYDRDPDAPASPGASTLPDGRLHRLSDRGSQVSLGYDARGRVRSLRRRIARPGAGAAAALTDRYVAAPFTQSFDYDDADREIGRGTGTDVAELLGDDGKGMVTTHYSARGIPTRIGGSYGALVRARVADADGLTRGIGMADPALTTESFTYDGRRRLTDALIERQLAPTFWQATATTPDGYVPPSVNDVPTRQMRVQGYHVERDGVGNPTSIADLRLASEWPAEFAPKTQAIVYDDDYRVTDVTYSAGSATGSASSAASTSPVLSRAMAFAANDSGDPSRKRKRTERLLPTTEGVSRVQHAAFTYDWQGNTTSTSDDASVFFDRSLGTITNGGPGAGPNQLTHAEITTGDHPGKLDATYDSAGNLVELKVARTIDSGTHLFRYDWDEVGQLARVRRFDYAQPPSSSSATSPWSYPYPQDPPAAPGVDVRFTYGADGGRVLRESVLTDGSLLYTIDVFDSLRLLTTWDPQKADYARSTSTEQVYLKAGGVTYGRLFYDDALVLPTFHATKVHVFLEFGDPVGSISTVIDRATSEVVSASTFLPYGGSEATYAVPRWNAFREDFAFTGQETDRVTGLTYFGARYYSPQLGRFLSADPASIHAAKADLNPYAYVGGRVFSRTDPTGLTDAPAAPATPPSDEEEGPSPGKCIGEMCISAATPGFYVLPEITIVGQVAPPAVAKIVKSLPPEEIEELVADESLPVQPYAGSWSPVMPPPYYEGNFTLPLWGTVYDPVDNPTWTLSGFKDGLLYTLGVGEQPEFDRNTPRDAGFSEGVLFGGSAQLSSMLPGLVGQIMGRGAAEGLEAAGGVASDARLFQAYKAELAAQEIQGADAVGSALKADPYHRSASFVTDMAADGKMFSLGNRTGTVNLTQVLGEMNGVPGRFEWIVDGSGNLTHQMFVRGGRITGVPIAP